MRPVIVLIATMLFMSAAGAQEYVASFPGTRVVWLTERREFVFRDIVPAWTIKVIPNGVESVEVNELLMEIDRSLPTFVSDLEVSVDLEWPTGVFDLLPTPVEDVFITEPIVFPDDEEADGQISGRYRRLLFDNEFSGDTNGIGDLQLLLNYSNFPEQVGITVLIGENSGFVGSELDAGLSRNLGITLEDDLRLWIAFFSAEIAIDPSGPCQVSFPGDANIDFQVDFADFLIVASNFGGEGVWQHGDFDCDSQIDIDDAMALFENFGAPHAVAANGEGMASAVPEPSTLIEWLVVGAVVWMGRRRRRDCASPSPEARSPSYPLRVASLRSITSRSRLSRVSV